LGLLYGIVGQANKEELCAVIAIHFYGDGGSIDAVNGATEGFDEHEGKEPKGF
jgi:hypothetical protein